LQQLAGLLFGAMHGIGAEVVVFVKFEVRQAVLPAPTRIAAHLGPMIVVA